MVSMCQGSAPMLDEAAGLPVSKSPQSCLDCSLSPYAHKVLYKLKIVALWWFPQAIHQRFRSRSQLQSLCTFKQQILQGRPCWFSQFLKTKHTRVTIYFVILEELTSRKGKRVGRRVEIKGVVTSAALKKGQQTVDEKPCFIMPACCYR